MNQRHQVEMITSGLENSILPCRSGEKFSFYLQDGIQVVSVRAGYNNARKGTQLSGWRRMLSFHNFSRLATQYCISGKKPDLVFATHTPLTVGLAGLEVKRRFGVPFVFEVRDLWPEALVNIGSLRNQMAISYLKWMARKIYRGADHIIAASPGMKEGIMNYGIPDDKIDVITQGCDLDLFSPDNDGASQRNRLGIGNRMAAIYFGAMGMANGLEYLLDAARILKDRGRDDIVIVFHGQGKFKESLKETAQKEGLTNTVFSDVVPSKRDLAKIVAGCDVALTIYKGSKETSWSPNKFFDGISAGKPVVTNVDGWLGRLVREAGCGIVSSAADPVTLADALATYADNPDRRVADGYSARKLAEERFSRKDLCCELERLLSDFEQVEK